MCLFYARHGGSSRAGASPAPSLGALAASVSSDLRWRARFAVQLYEVLDAAAFRALEPWLFRVGLTTLQPLVQRFWRADNLDLMQKLLQLVHTEGAGPVLVAAALANWRVGGAGGAMSEVDQQAVVHDFRQRLALSRSKQTERGRQLQTAMRMLDHAPPLSGATNAAQPVPARQFGCAAEPPAASAVVSASTTATNFSTPQPSAAPSSSSSSLFDLFVSSAEHRCVAAPAPTAATPLAFAQPRREEGNASSPRPSDALDNFAAVAQETRSSSSDDRGSLQLRDWTDAPDSKAAAAAMAALSSADPSAAMEVSSSPDVAEQTSDAAAADQGEQVSPAPRARKVSPPISTAATRRQSAGAAKLRVSISPATAASGSTRSKARQSLPSAKRKHAEIENDHGPGGSSEAGETDADAAPTRASALGADGQDWRASCADEFAFLLHRYPQQLQESAAIDVTTAEAGLQADAVPSAMLVRGLAAASTSPLDDEAIQQELLAALATSDTPKAIMQMQLNAAEPVQPQVS